MRQPHETQRTLLAKLPEHSDRLKKRQGDQREARLGRTSEETHGRERSAEHRLEIRGAVQDAKIGCKLIDKQCVRERVRHGLMGLSIFYVYASIRL